MNRVELKDQIQDLTKRITAAKIRASMERPQARRTIDFGIRKMKYRRLLLKRQLRSMKGVQDGSTD